MDLVREGKGEAGFELGHELLIRAQPLGWMHQAPGAGIEGLCGVLQLALRFPAQSASAFRDLLQKLFARRACELRGSGRGRRACVSGEIGDGEIGLVADAHHHGDRAGADGARQRLFVELPQVLDRAAAAHEEQHVALGAPPGALEHGDHPVGRACALHRRRVDDDRDRRVTPRERGQHILQRRRSERGHDPDGAGKARRRALEALVEQALRAELLLEPQEALVERPEAGAAHALDRELEAATRLVQRRQGPHLDLHAIARLPVEGRGAAAEHDAVDLRGAVLQGEVTVAGGGARQVGELPAHPGEGKAPLEGVAHAAQQFRHRQDA